MELPKFDFNETGQFDLLSLTKEDQVEHLRQISFIHNSPAHHREIDAMIAGLQHWIMIEADLDDTLALKAARQALVFIQGLKDRYAVLSTQFKSSNAPKKEITRKSPIG